MKLIQSIAKNIKWCLNIFSDLDFFKIPSNLSGGCECKQWHFEM